MAVRFGVHPTGIRFDLRSILRGAAKQRFGSVGEVAFDFASNFVEGWDSVPEEPFHQQDLKCNNCDVATYLSANGILFCLKCRATFGRMETQRETPRQAYDPFFYNAESTNTGTNHAGNGNGTRRNGQRNFRTATFRTARQPPSPPRVPSIAPEVTKAFKVLQLDPKKTTVDEVYARQKKLALKHHPDRGGSSDKMAEINAAADLAATYLTERA